MAAPEAQLDEFIDKFSVEVATLARSILTKMRKRLPGAIELVYDNYNALAIGFAKGERTSDAPFSIALYPRWVSLFFLQGATLPDPAGILKGSGNVVRHIVLSSAEDIAKAEVEILIQLALDRAEWIPKKSAKGRIVIKSVSPNQRPRLPGPSSVRSKAKTKP